MPVRALTLKLPESARSTARPQNPGWHVAAAAILVLAILIRVAGLERCGPALGLPKAPRQFVLCLR